MSRIVRAPVDAGQVIDAGVLNATYNDYNQPGALDANNVRDQAFDLPHLSSVAIVKNSATALLGDATMLHAGPAVNYPSSTASPPTVTRVGNAAGTPTFLNFGASGWPLVAGDVLRVWWNMGVVSFIGMAPPTPYLNAGAMGQYTLADKAAGPSHVVTDGFHCWLAYLQWDITSNALANFVAVSGQMDPALGVKGTTKDGFELERLSAGTVISPYQVTSDGDARDGKVSATLPTHAHGWYAPYGMYCFTTNVPITVYGVRLVITGLLHPFLNPAGNRENLLVYDYTQGNALYFLTGRGGRMSAVQMRRA